MQKWRLGEIAKTTHVGRFFMAEREGFEPSLTLRLNQISSLARSTTLPPLHNALVESEQSVSKSPVSVNAAFASQKNILHVR